MSECGVKTAEEHSARKSRQAVAKRAQPSSSEGDSNRKKARRGSGVEAPSQGIFRSEAGFEFSADDESEEEGELVSVTSVRHQN